MVMGWCSTKTTSGKDGIKSLIPHTGLAVPLGVAVQGMIGEVHTARRQATRGGPPREVGTTRAKEIETMTAGDDDNFIVSCVW